MLERSCVSKPGDAYRPRRRQRTTNIGCGIANSTAHGRSPNTRCAGRETNVLQSTSATTRSRAAEATRTPSGPENDSATIANSPSGGMLAWIDLSSSSYEPVWGSRTTMGLNSGGADATSGSKRSPVPSIPGRRSTGRGFFTPRSARLTGQPRVGLLTTRLREHEPTELIYQATEVLEETVWYVGRVLHATVEMCIVDRIVRNEAH